MLTLQDPTDQHIACKLSRRPLQTDQASGLHAKISEYAVAFGQLAAGRGATGQLPGAPKVPSRPEAMHMIVADLKHNCWHSHQPLDLTGGWTCAAQCWGSCYTIILVDIKSPCLLGARRAASP